MPLLKGLNVFKEEPFEEPLVYLDTLFFQYIKDRLAPNDKLKLRKDIMIRDFRGHKAGIKDLETGKAITVSSVLRFIFNHFEDFVICHDIVLGIQGNKFSGAESYTKTLYGLYQSLGNMDLSLALYTDIEIDDCDTTTLNDQYKNYFGQNEWKKSAFLKTIISIIWQAKVKTLKQV